MDVPESGSKLGRIVGALLLLLGVAVFAIRLQHAGPYDPPEGGNLAAALAAFALGAFLVLGARARGGLATAARAAALLASVPVAFFGLYATLAELEEVVVLEATDRSGAQVGLRLWIVDHEGVPWVTMPRAKAEAHGLGDGTPVRLLRAGAFSCRLPVRYEDRETVNRIHHLRHEVYAVQRFATAIGLFGEDAAATGVALRLDPCPPTS